MDIRQLEYFLAVVDNGGINKAAKVLYLAQPSLSQAIRGLERDVGTPLFLRVGRGVVLTEAGRALVEPARQVVRGLEVARASIESVHQLASGRVAIAAMPSPTVEPLSSMIAGFTQRYPGVSVTIKNAPIPGAVIDMVRDGVAELGLLSAWEPPTASQVRIEPIEEQRFVLVCPPDSPFTAQETVPRQRLGGQRLIVGEHGTGIRRLVEEMRADGIEAEIVVETEHREAVLPLVLKGIGIGILAEAWRPLAERAGAVVCELAPPASLELFIVARQGWLSPAAEAFLADALPTPAEEEQG